MRELRERIRTEGWRRIEGSLLFSHKQVELTPAPNERAEGCFDITGTAGGQTEGFVFVEDERMQCLTHTFGNGNGTIGYCFDAEGMQNGETRSGRFLVVSNCGEYELPWKVEVRRKVPESSMGEIRNLFHFANLARANWQEAVKFFYTQEFKIICGEENEELFNLYRGFSGSLGNEANVEGFLVAVHKKQPIGFSAVQKEIRLGQVTGNSSEELLLLKNGWGPVKLRVEVWGDFLNTEKSWLTDDDFLGNQCRFSLFVEEGRMHEGKNFGKVVFRYTNGCVEVSVIAEKKLAQAKGKGPDSHACKKYTLQLVKLYQQYRMKRINMKTWRSGAKECIGQLQRLSPKDLVPQLFAAQLFLTQDKTEEARRILGQAAGYIEEAEPAVYCYYVYLTTLYNREENYVERAVAKVEQVFLQNPMEWRIAWLLLFLSREVNRSAARKWAFLEEQFRAGCTSPVLYLEALLLLNANPAFLGKLDSPAKRILLYGAKNRYLSDELTGQAVYLINREKYYDPVLFEILKRSWEKKQDLDILQAICTLLVKGAKQGIEYYPWYLKGVQKKCRITRLYEHYLMSMDRERQTEIPKIVLLYFAYQSNLDYESAAYLYAYVERHKQQDQELYIAYRPQMERFALAQLYKGRVNRDLAFLYRTILTDSILKPEHARALASLLSCVEVNWGGDARKLVVVHARTKGEKTYLFKNGRAYVSLFSRQDMLFAEDEEKNRRLINDEASVFPLFTEQKEGDAKLEYAKLPDLGELGERVAPYAGEDLSFHLMATDSQQVAVRKENVASYLAIAQEPVLSRDYGRKVRFSLVEFLFDEGQTEELDRLLKKLEPEDIAPMDRNRVVHYLVLQGFCEKAYAWLKGLDFGKQDARILMRLCSRLLDQQLFREDKRMTQLCYLAAVRGKYDGLILQQLTGHYRGSVGEMEAVKNAAEGFGVNTFPLCERIMEQLLYTQKDVTERMDLLRQYVAEGGGSELETAFLHRCSACYVLYGQPIHISIIRDILRVYQLGEDVTDMCKAACLKYYAKNRAAMDENVEAVLRAVGSALLLEGRILPVFKEFADIIPGTELLLDQTFVVYRGVSERKAILNYRILKGQECQEDYQSVEMSHVYDGIYVRTFILYPGESLQYYVTEADAPKKIVDSNLIKADERTEAACASRYGLLCEATESLLQKPEGQDRQQAIEPLNRYLYRQYCAERLFGILE